MNTTFCIHDDNQIAGFELEYDFLSNFYPCPIAYSHLVFPSVENAYQAAKVMPADRGKFLTCSAAESKKLWKRCNNRFASPEDFDAVKDDLMSELVFRKFLDHRHLREKLLAAGDKKLIESNYLHDNYWGACVCEKCKDVVKHNKLGRILMKTRTFWKL